MLGNTKWSTKEIEAKVEEIATKLSSLGFELVPCEYYGVGNATFRRKGDEKLFYQGTYLNLFTKNETPQLWLDSNMIEHKSIHLHEVYRHNGTLDNASIDLTVGYSGCANAPTFHTYTYANGESETKRTWNLTSKSEKCRRFKPTLSEKLTDKMIAQAVEKYEAIELKDWSAYELNRADFHKSTEVEFREFHKAKREKEEAERAAKKN